MLKRQFYFLLVMMALSGHAYGCGFLESGDPKVGSMVDGSVSRVALTFSEKVYPAASEILVTNVEGGRMNVGKAFGVSGNDALVVTSVKTLPPGKYKVSWKVLCDCGSLMPGSYKFTVR